MDEDLFQKKYLEEIYELQTKLESATVTFQDKEYTVNDLCFKAIEGRGCMTTSPMEFWKMNIEEMRKDKDIKSTAQCLFKIDNTEMPCFDRNEIPIIIESIFGQQSCEGGGVQTDCNNCRKISKALSKKLNC